MVVHTVLCLKVLTYSGNTRNIFDRKRSVENVVAMEIYLYLIGGLSSCGVTMPPSDILDGSAHRGSRGTIRSRLIQ